MANALGGGMAKLQDALIETERLGEKFLAVKEQLVDADKRRQETREALTALRKMPAKCDVVLQRPAGASFVLTNDRAQARLQLDQGAVEQRLEALRIEEKRLVGQLADKGVSPEAVGPGMMRAMLTLHDTPDAG